MRADRDGGVAVALATGFIAPRAIAVDGGTVYWADEGDRGMGAVLALGPGAAAPEVLSDPPGTALQSQGLSVSREGVCWTGGGIEKVLWVRPFPTRVSRKRDRPGTPRPGVRGERGRGIRGKRAPDPVVLESQIRGRENPDQSDEARS
ncbi:MAG: hypothetical protein ACJ79O_09470 [Myxococcales bacterium]